MFCDACDKGYHMQCHVPPMSTTPIGENLTFDHFNRPGSKLKGLSHVSLVHFVNTAEPRFIEPTSIQQSPRYNEQFPLPQ